MPRRSIIDDSLRARRLGGVPGAEALVGEMLGGEAEEEALGLTGVAFELRSWMGL